MNKINSLSLMMIFLIFTHSSKSSLIINEIMPAPKGDEPEWIEIYNPDDTPYDFTDLRICDMKKCVECSVYVAPHSFAIISPDPLKVKELRNIPENVKLYKASFPGLNNTFDAVVLKDSNNNILDSTYYNMDNGEKGISFERVDPFEPGYGDNLTICTSNSGATPGTKNSVSPIDHDAEIFSVELNKNKIQAKIINNGILPFNIRVILDVSGNGIIDKTYQLIDSLIILSNKLEYIGLQTVKCEIVSDDDEIASNNIYENEINFPPEAGSITINEIMYDVDEFNSEYIELFNNTEYDINLKDFSIHDEASLNKTGIIIDSDQFIKADAYLVIAEDSLILDSFLYLKESNNYYITNKALSLNKSDDIVVLKSSDGEICDSVHYQDEWHNSSLLTSKNISIEKFATSLPSYKRDSWASSVDERGGTPGIENSVFLDINFSGELSIEPNPFSPYSTNSLNECIINYNFDFRDASITAKVFNRNGSILKELKNNQNSAGSGTIKWDGTNEEGYKLQPGAYILIFQIKNNDNDKTYIKKAVIVIGK